MVVVFRQPPGDHVPQLGAVRAHGGGPAEIPAETALLHVPPRQGGAGEEVLPQGQGQLPPRQGLPLAEQGVAVREAEELLAAQGGQGENPAPGPGSQAVPQIVVILAQLVLRALLGQVPGAAQVQPPGGGLRPAALLQPAEGGRFFQYGAQQLRRALLKQHLGVNADGDHLAPPLRLDDR